MHQSTTKSGSACVVCGGDVLTVSSSVYDATSGPLLIGPGSANQFRTVTSHHTLRVSWPPPLPCGTQYGSAASCPAGLWR